MHFPLLRISKLQLLLVSSQLIPVRRVAYVANRSGDGLRHVAPRLGVYQTLVLVVRHDLTSS